MDQQVPFRYSKEELRVLAECNRESFYNRCVPFSTIFGLSTFYAVKAGYLAPNARLGATPKVFGAVIVGYLLGKISYQKVCVEKLMALPDSKLGAILRNRYSGKKALTMDMPESDRMISGLNEEEKYDDVRKTSHMDIDTDRPSYSGMDDIYRPPVDPFTSHEIDEPLPKHPATTYEELRRKNREEYEKNQKKSLYREVVTPEVSPSAKNRPADEKKYDWFDSPPASKKPSTNIYGDPMDK